MSARGCLVVGSDTGVGTGRISASLSLLLGQDGPCGAALASDLRLPAILVIGLRAACLDRALRACLGIVPWLARPDAAAMSAFLDPVAIRAAIVRRTEPSPVQPVGP